MATYEKLIENLAHDLGADGGVPEFYHWACLEHDVHYRTHCRFKVNKTGTGLTTVGPITQLEADNQLLKSISKRNWND